jgi:4-amino-4-deoxy-L-arabinose transferase-like glycosyltransferase
MTDRRSIGLLLALHLVIVAIVQPRGDFPLNDDWAYAHSVQWLLSEGRVRLSDWIAMNLLPQTLGGGLVAAIFGFSFETLRHLTQLVAALTSIAAYFWFRSARLEPADALAASVAMIAFPAWPVLANSYMTDLYGLLFALPAAALFLRALERPTRGVLALATLVAALGVLQRQVVIVLPAAFMVAWLWANRRWTLRTVLVGIAPVAAVVLAEIAYQAYLMHGPGVPEAQRMQHGHLVPMILKIFSNEDRHGEFVVLNFLTIFGYLGLFSVGWAAWWGLRGATRRLRGIVVLAGVAIAVIALANGWLPPYRPNHVIDPTGIGPYTLYDVHLPRFTLERGPNMFWGVMAVAGAFGAAALAVLLGVNAAHLVCARRGAAPRSSGCLWSSA